MKIILTHKTNPETLTPFESDQCYNGLDVCITHDVYTAIAPQLDDTTTETYALSKALQGPCLEMRVRGVLVDQARKTEVIDEYIDAIDRLEHNLERIVLDGVGMATFNWRSNPDLQRLFYVELGLPPIRKFGRPTTDRNARERLSTYPTAKAICLHINAISELAKKVSVLKTEIDTDGRIRTSYNIAGTNTGRFSSSFSEYGTGGNLQNIEESLRSIFIADPGFKFAKFDAKSGESFIVGAIEWNLFSDATYLEVCESGDPHTAVAKICWPTLNWTGKLSDDKHVAEQPYYRHYTYRFMCKKLGHGSNYGGKPHTLAQQSHLPQSVVEEFQPKYFRAFPGHLSWQEWTNSELRRCGHLTTLTGRKRWFFGRRGDPATLREAIAYNPQGSLADIVNRAMLRIWRAKIATVMMHDHDALTFMYPEKDEDIVIPKLYSALVESIPLANNRTLRIPYDCKVGWNKGDYNAQTNPAGLKDYNSHDERVRPKKMSILDRIIHRGNLQPRRAGGIS